MVVSTLGVARRVLYPESADKPMAESDFQRRPLTDAIESLEEHFRDRPDVYVSGNLFIYFEEGNPEAVVAPDVFVVVGTTKRDRSCYFLWQEPKGPDFVLEVTSRSSRSTDQGAKKGTYSFLNVREYFQYDPTHDYLDPPLKGLRLENGNYVAIPAEQQPDGSLSLRSDVLDLELRLEAESGDLRFYDPATGEKLLTHQESEDARRKAEQQLVEARQRIFELETRLRAVEPEIRGGTPAD